MRKILVIALLLGSLNVQAQLPRSVLIHFLNAYEENEIRKELIVKQDSTISLLVRRDLLRMATIRSLEQEIVQKDLIIQAKDGIITIKDDNIEEAEKLGKEFKKQRNLAYIAGSLLLAILILTLIPQ